LNVTLHEPARREELKETLNARGIGFGVVYPGAMSAQAGASGFLREQIGGENARWLSDCILNLPLFPYITDEEVDEVVTALRGA
ncbi:MAG: DegT/DnrJ/EryC1/StrS family aminotransferase, partial [Verrucomicrobiota bacterium]